VRVLIVDDHAAVRGALADVLVAAPELEPVGSAATAGDAATQARLLSPDVAIVDYQLPGRDGLSLTLELKHLPHAPRVLIYSAFADARLAVGAMVVGADGIVNKSTTADELCAAIRNVARGLSVTPEVPSQTMSVIEGELAREDRPILAMMMNGVPLGQVAEALGTTHEWLAIRRWAILKRVINERSDRRPKRSLREA
jgi:DNA-binding NarL/FixJ family response regulator